MALTLRLTPDEQEKLDYLMHKAGSNTASAYFKSLMHDDEPRRLKIEDQSKRVRELEYANRMLETKMANLKTALSDIFLPSE